MSKYRFIAVFLLSFLSFVLLPNLATGQQADSTSFHALEYYHIRLAKGFGAGVEQAVDTDGGVARKYLTRPFIYMGLSDKLAFALSNQTIWSTDTGQQVFFVNNRETEMRANHLTQLSVNYFPASGLLVNASANFSNGQPFSTILSNDDNENRDFTLRGIYYSRGSQIEYQPNQRVLIYYGKNWFGVDFLPVIGLGSLTAPVAKELAPPVAQPASLFSKGQSFAIVNGSSNRQSVTSLTQVSTGATTNDDLLLTSEARREYIDMKVGHSFRDNFNLGAGLYYFRSTSRLFLSETQGYADGREYANSKRLAVSGWAEQVLSRHWRHRVTAEVTRISSRFSTSTYLSPEKDELFNVQEENFFSGNYAFQRMWRAADPGTTLFLADRDDLFGHRLPKGGWQLVGSASWAFNFDFDKRRINQTKNDSKRLSLALVNGKSSHLELGAVTILDRYTFETDANDVVLIPSSKNTSAAWNYGLVVNLTNYQFTEKERALYGWHELSQFDRLYGSLLRSGMVKLTIGALHGFEYSHRVERSARNGVIIIDESEWNPRDIQFYGRARIGIKRGLEVDLSVTDAAETGNIAFSAQLLRSIRLRAEYNSSINSRDYFFMNR
ncbi:MAG: hypothetical protein ACE5I1_11565, partial [bacterium]